MDFITWPIAVTIIGGIFAVVMFLVQIFKKEEPWKSDVQRMADLMQDRHNQTNHRITVLESKHEELTRRMEDVRNDLQEESESTEKNLNKMDTKFEKLSDMVMSLFRNKN